MSLNNISLTNHLLSQLYPNSLLENESITAPAQIPEAPTTHNLAGANGMDATKTFADTEAIMPVQNNPQTIPAKAASSFPSASSTNSAPAALAPVVAYGNTPSLGGNKKGILILVSNDAVPFLPDAELEFLSSILGACRLSIADVAIINLYHYPQAYTALLQQFESRQVLLMGVTPQQIDLPFHFPHFQLQNFDQRTYLAALPLGQIAESRDLKMQLWGCLKTMFGI